MIHNASVYQPHAMLTAMPDRSGLLSYLRAGTLAVWVFTLLVRYWWLSDWFALQEQFQQGVNIRAYYYIGFAIALVAHLTLGLEILIAAPFKVLETWSGRLLTIFCVVTLLTAPLSLVFRATAVYAVATWGVLAMFVLYWQSDYRVVRKMVVLAGIVVLGWLYILLLKHGLIQGFGSAIGGVNRNTTATAALAGAILCQFSPRRLVRWAALAGALLLAVLVTSRGSLTAMGAFVFVYYALHRGVFKTVLHAAAAGFVVVMLLLAITPLRDFLINDVMLLNDPHRGIGSGFTGRFEFWKHAIDSFWDNPVIGVGFRSTTHGGGGDYGAVHSGYLKLLIETGLVGTILVLSAVVIEGVRRLRLAERFRDIPPAFAPGIDIASTTQVNAIACATIAMTLTLWVYEQLYINLGSVISLVFFLMLAAPAYITTQGVPLRR